MAEPLTSARASAVRFELPPPFNVEVVIPAPSLQQVADCIRLDPRPTARAVLEARAAELRAAGYTVTAPEGPIAETPAAETDRERILRMIRQAEILLGRKHAHLAAKLTMGQVAEVVQSLYLAAGGIDPTDFLAVQAYLRKLRADPREAAQLLADIERMTIELAAALKITPAEAARMPVADAVSLSKKLAEQANAEAKFIAAVHGAKLS